MKTPQITSLYSARPVLDARQKGLFGLCLGAIFLFVVTYVGLACLGLEDQQAFGAALTFSVSMIFFGQVAALVNHVKRGAQEKAEKSSKDEYDLDDLELSHQRVTAMLNTALKIRAEVKKMQPAIVERRVLCISASEVLRKQGLNQSAQNLQDVADILEELMDSGKKMNRDLEEVIVAAVEIEREIEQKAAVAEAVILLQQKIDSVSAAEAKFTTLHEQIIRKLEHSA